jgi:hypothetical protein
MTKSKKILLACTLWVIAACGTGIGNGFFDPTLPPTSSSIDLPNIYDEGFETPVQEYNNSSSVDCGSFSEDSTVGAIDQGRQCIRDALDTCTPSKYLYDKLNSNGSRFVSFVSVKLQSSNPLECEVRVRTVSNVNAEPINDVRTCADFTENQIPEAACGILD